MLKNLQDKLLTCLLFMIRLVPLRVIQQAAQENGS
jgi:hypothetical protein